MHNSRLTIILPYKLDTTNDLLTSRAGLLAMGQLMDSLSLAERIDHYFPQPKSNRGYKPSEFIKTLILMQHEGSFHLDEVRHIQDDEALRIDAAGYQIKIIEYCDTQGINKVSTTPFEPKPAQLCGHRLKRLGHLSNEFLYR